VPDGRDPSIEAELRLQIMQLRDHAIGSAASVGELRAQLSERQAQLSHLHAVLAETRGLLELKTERLARLRKDLDAHDTLMRATATWKIGRFVMLPMRILRRLLR